MKTHLLDLVRSRKARIGVIGQGYVGLPLALIFTEVGYPVTGFDVDPRKVEKLRRGESFIKHIGADRVRAAVTPPPSTSTPCATATPSSSAFPPGSATTASLTTPTSTPPGVRS
jgi:UDP-N-acetyl-D-mannosaminuronate dehydrogenase